MARIGWLVASVGGVFALVGGVAFVAIVIGSTRGRVRRSLS
jgi:hypothetical protein